MLRRLLPALVVALGVGAWLLPDSIPFVGVGPDGYAPWPEDPWGDSRRPEFLRRVRVTKDDRPVFRIDPSRPWQIALGRGSGRDGLATVRVDNTGRLVVHREHAERDGAVWVASWKTASATLPPEAVAAVLEAVETTRLSGLDRAYTAEGVCDGSQWVLWLRQGDREKAVYFDNHFPDPIVRFARRLDEIIAGSVGPGLRWRRVAPWSGRGHDAELWDAIKR